MAIETMTITIDSRESRGTNMNENVHGAKVQHLIYNVKNASGNMMVIVTRVLSVGPSIDCQDFHDWIYHYFNQ